MPQHMLAKKPGTPGIVEQASDFEPMRIIEVELGQPLPDVSACDENTDRYYRRALCLVRLHTQPLGLVTLQLDEHGVSAEEYAANIWQALSEKINAHLRQDGLPEVTGLSALGLSNSSIPACLEERARFVAQAPFVSVIVPTRDRPEQVRRCLQSLLALHYPQYEIIVVDNAPSSCATADLIQQTYGNVPQVHYEREDRPGSSWARNRGMMAARGEILAFADDDVIIDRYWLVELVRAFGRADEVACVTGLVLPVELETSPQLWFEEKLGAGWLEGNDGSGGRFTRHIFDMAEHHPKTPLYPYTVGNLGGGANMAFTAAFLRSVGGFDPALSASSPARSGEDTAAFFQAVTRGYKLVYEPAALVYHLHHRDYAGLQKQIYGYGVGLTAYLMKIVLEQPRFLFDLVSKLPYGLFFMLNVRSPKNSQKSQNYPKELTMLERKGMLYGPFAYLRSRWAIRHPRKIAASTGVYSASDLEEEA